MVFVILMTIISEKLELLIISIYQKTILPDHNLLSIRIRLFLSVNISRKWAKMEFSRRLILYWFLLYTNIKITYVYFKLLATVNISLLT